jgi:GTP-binding protein
LESAKEVKEERFKRVKTWIFNSFLEQVILKHPPTWTRKSHKPKIYYGSQVDINPPKFVLSVNNSEHFHFSYKRYLENKIRDNFGFFGTPIIIEYRGKNSG